MEQANSNATSSIAQDGNQNIEDTDREQMLTEEEIDAFI
jgi:hypothetical protein